MHKDNPVTCFTSLRDRSRTEAHSEAQTWFSQQSRRLDDREPKPSRSLWQSAFLKLWLVTPGLVTDLFLVGNTWQDYKLFYLWVWSLGETSPGKDHLAGWSRFRWLGEKIKSLLPSIAKWNSVLSSNQNIWIVHYFFLMIHLFWC